MTHFLELAEACLLIETYAIAQFTLYQIKMFAHLTNTERKENIHPASKPASWNAEMTLTFLISLYSSTSILLMDVSCKVFMTLFRHSSALNLTSALSSAQHCRSVSIAIPETNVKSHSLYKILNRSTWKKNISRSITLVSNTSG